MKVSICFFFINDTATTEIYTLSLHDALPISPAAARETLECAVPPSPPRGAVRRRRKDRKSTRLNSSHQIISYAVFCLKKKKKKNPTEFERISAPKMTSVCPYRYLLPRSYATC